jgi:hypothetical protein
MKVFHTNLNLVLGALLLLSACSGASEQASQLKEKADQAQNMAKTATGSLGNMAILKDSLSPITSGASQTLAAVKAGDFSTAQTEFAKVQTEWQGVKTKLQETSPDAVKTISGKIQTIATDLKATPPNPAKLTTELQGLSTTVAGLLKPGGAAVTADASPAAGGEAMSADAGGTAMQSNLTAMQAELAKATTAVEAKDFAAAKESFTAARQTWFKFGGSVKQKSADTYQTLEDGVKSVNSGLTQAQPDQATIATALKDLSSNLASVK